MKLKTISTFGILLIFILYFCFYLFNSSENKNANAYGLGPDTFNPKRLPDLYKIVTIDGCEYIMASAYGHYSAVFTHKGNCKNH